ncbi:MAG: lysine exporter LysO family protein [Neisseriaceae bacterium]|nr:lysine exporter LysO family protein [Neisseriaceae bacterium]
MFYTLLLILTPLFVGFCINVNNQRWLKHIDKSVSLLVYLILFVMGVGLGGYADLFRELSTIGGYTVVFFLLINVANMLALSWYDRRAPLATTESRGQNASTWGLVKSALTLLGYIVAGFAVGYTLKDYGHLPDAFSTVVLMALLLLIGIQLRSSGIGLRRVLINKRGLIMSVLFMASSLLGGLLAALLLGLPLFQGLSIASGFGWYSLSSIVITDAFGPVMGSVAFLNDLLREFLAFALIPLLMRRHPSTAIGIGGATSLDFVLPVIQRSGGIEVVPIAISFGFVVNICSPILMIFFAQLG